MADARAARAAIGAPDDELVAQLGRWVTDLIGTE